MPRKRLCPGSSKLSPAMHESRSSGLSHEAAGPSAHRVAVPARDPDLRPSGEGPHRKAVMASVEADLSAAPAPALPGGAHAASAPVAQRKPSHRRPSHRVPQPRKGECPPRGPQPWPARKLGRSRARAGQPEDRKPAGAPPRSPPCVCRASSIMAWFARPWSSIMCWPKRFTAGERPFCCASCPSCTSAIPPLAAVVMKVASLVERAGFTSPVPPPDWYWPPLRSGAARKHQRREGHAQNCLLRGRPSTIRCGRARPAAFPVPAAKGRTPGFNADRRGSFVARTPIPSRPVRHVAPTGFARMPKP